jgi:hypothetical protein
MKSDSVVGMAVGFLSLGDNSMVFTAGPSYWEVQIGKIDGPHSTVVLYLILTQMFRLSSTNYDFYHHIRILLLCITCRFLFPREIERRCLTFLNSCSFDAGV